MMDIIANFMYEHGISHEEVYSALSYAFEKMWEKLYGPGYKMELDISNGDFGFYRILEVVDSVEDFKTQVNGKDFGSIIKERQNLDWSQSSVNEILRVLKDRVCEIKKQREYDFYKDQVDNLFNVVVKRTVGKNLEVRLAGGYSGIIPWKLSVQRERFQPGDKIKCRLTEVRFNLEGSQLIFERRSPEFIELLLKDMIPEISNEIVVVKKVARDAGVALKVLLHSDEPTVNVIGVCVGFGGKRRMMIMKELCGEKVDFILWKKQLYQQILSCFHKIPIVNIFNNDEEGVCVVIPHDKFGEALGAGGRNVSLISRLLETKIKLIDEEDFKEREAKSREAEISNLETYGISKEIAECIINCENVKDIINKTQSEEEKNSVLEYFHNLRQEYLEHFHNMGGDPSIIPEEVDFKICENLVENNLRNAEDLREFSPQELSYLTKIPIEQCLVLLTYINEAF